MTEKTTYEEEYFKRLAAYRDKTPSKFDGNGKPFKTEAEARAFDKKTIPVIKPS